MFVTMIDQKPKTTTTLKRLDNIEANPRVSVLVDAWSEDWSELWWVRVDGTAKTHDSGDLWEVARSLLVAKYPQYRQDPPRGPAIVITVDTVRFWEGTQ
jgi:PPOX class probable F420-dependent enzyme